MSNLLFNYIIAHALVAGTLAALGFCVLLQNTKSRLYRTFFLFNASIAWWALCTVFMQFASNSRIALYWDRAALLAIAFIPTFILHCTLEYIHKTENKKFFLHFSYLGSSIFFLISLTTLMAKNVSQKGFITYFTDPGLGYHVFMIFFLLVMLSAVYFLYQSYVIYKDRLYSKGILYLLIATIIAALGGSANFLVSYGLIVPILVPFGTYALILYAVVTAYIILRYRWFDIEVIIKKTLVFAGLFGFVFSVIIIVALVTQEFIAKYMPHSRYFALAVSAVIIVFLQQPVYNLLVNITNRYLFQKEYDPKKILRKFADEVLTMLSLEKICNVTINTLTEHLYLTNCAVFLLSREELGYEIYDSFGIDNKEIYFDTNSSLTKYLEGKRLPLLYQSYDKSLQASKSIKKDMDKAASQLCMPLLIRDELVGILSLGAKKSDQTYNADDIDILTTLAKALSISISNARLFMQAAQNEKLATIGTITSAINHEIGGPLSRISLRIQMYAEDRKNEISENKFLKENLEKAENIMSSTIDEIGKVTDIASKLSGFAKPSKIVESKPVNIRDSIKGALDLLNHKLQLDKIEVKQNVPADLPKIVVDANQMQQIFFNLVRNAAEAIKEHGIVLITAKEGTGKIMIEIQDTGSGIPEGKLNKIFQPFYTTKGELKGSGYGLAVVKELIQRNDGSIRVDSKVCKGTTFYLEFQKA